VTFTCLVVAAGLCALALPLNSPLAPVRRLVAANILSEFMEIYLQTEPITQLLLRAKSPWKSQFKLAEACIHMCRFNLNLIRSGGSCNGRSLAVQFGLRVHTGRSHHCALALG